MLYAACSATSRIMSAVLNTGSRLLAYRTLPGRVILARLPVLLPRLPGTKTC